MDDIQHARRKRGGEQRPKVEAKKEDLESEVRSFAHRYFSELYNKEKEADDTENALPQRGGAFEALRRVQQTLAKLSGSSREWNDLYITPAMSKAAAVFLNELIEFVQNLRRANVTTDKIERFTAAVHQELFSSSPNLVNLFGMSDQLVFAARATRSPEMQGFVGPSMIGELTYNLAYSEPDAAQSMVKRIKTYSPATQIDVLHTLTSVGADAVANGDWAERAVDYVVGMASNLVDESPYPLVRLAAHVTADRISAEVDNPSLGVVRYQGDRGQGRAVAHRKQSVTETAYGRQLDYVLQRGEKLELVAQGYLGVVDSSGRLLRLGQITDGVIETKNLEQVLETDPSVLPYGQETASEELAVLFAQMHRPELRGPIDETLGVPLSHLSLRGELQLVQYLSQKNDTQFVSIQEALEKPGLNVINFLESFFACTENKALGDALVSFVKDTDAAVVNGLLARYVQLVNLIERIEKEVGAFFKSDSGRALDKRQIVRQLVKKANLVLNRGLVSKDSKDVESDLRSVEEELVLFSSIFEVAARTAESPLDINTVRGTSFEKKDATTLTAAEKLQMQHIFSTNRMNNPAYPKEYAEERSKEFAALLEEPNKRWYTYSKEGRLVAFVHYEDHGEKVYLGSFNVDPSARDGGIGSPFLEATLEKEGQHKPVILNVNGENPYRDMYIQKFGFAIDHIEENHRGTGKAYYYLERPSTERLQQEKVA